LVTVGDVGNRGAIVAGRDAGKAIDVHQELPLPLQPAPPAAPGPFPWLSDPWQDGLGAVAAPWR